MNRMVSLARIMFAGLGIYLAISFVQSFIMLIVQIFKAQDKPEVLATSAVSLLIPIVLFLVIVWAFFIKGDKWARKLIAKGVGDDTPLDVNLTLIMAFRLICVGAGLLCLRSFVFRLSYQILHIGMTVKMLSRDGQDISFFRSYLAGINSLEHVFLVVLLLLTIYLLCGAPHFVRWQVKKTEDLLYE